jgi:hypothetical protein
MKHPPSWLSLFEHDARRRGDRGGWNRGRPWGCLLVVAVLFWPINSQALPSFARQTNMSCIVCHTSYPELTSFGRTFKLGGYTLSTGSSNLPPVAIMLQPSFTHTDRSQAGGAAPGFQPNNNFAMTQASFFYAGRILGPYATDLLGTDAAAFANKIGVFIQTTYDGIAKTWALDNTEVRYASTGSMGEHAATFGVYANNNPTMQDPWNSTAAWGYPFTSSGLAPTPAAATLLDGGFAQQVAGAGGYVMFDNTLYQAITHSAAICRSRLALTRQERLRSAALRRIGGSRGKSPWATG